MHHFTQRALSAVAVVSVVIQSYSVEAGCPCKKRGGQHSAVVSGWGADVYSSAPVYSGGEYLAAPTAAAPYRANFQVEPPPGTLGKTYQMKSRPIPAEMHPRVAMIDIRIKDATDVHVHMMDPRRMEDALEGFQDHDDPDMWHFQTDALIMGINQVYRVEVTLKGDGDEPLKEQRYVRLIPGRLIEVEFN